MNTSISLSGAVARYGKLIFLVTAAAVVGTFMYVSARLVSDLSEQERVRMEIWADATREILRTATADGGGTDIDFLLRIIESNTTIPVLLTDDAGNILQHRNFALPEPADSMALGEVNRDYLRRKLAHLASSPNVIDIDAGPDLRQHLYYEDSTLLKRLSFYPYVMIAVLVAFVAAVYLAMLSSKRAEQNKVWVGLSKETAHQLGTPISSLMAWMEILPEMGLDHATVAEMDKDVRRLGTIASRFSKIGSVPKIDPADLNTIVGNATTYMATRISDRITLDARLCDRPLPVRACAPLFEWVMENLIKNAVDAMDGAGSITVTTGADHARAFIEVTDTGKGIPRKNFKTVFQPGYTTKKRGWGLGLALARRIVAQYHRGSIYVKSSVPGRGTTFRIEIPLTDGE